MSRVQTTVLIPVSTSVKVVTDEVKGTGKVDVPTIVLETDCIGGEVVTVSLLVCQQKGCSGGPLILFGVCYWESDGKCLCISPDTVVCTWLLVGISSIDYWSYVLIVLLHVWSGSISVTSSCLIL